jgi:hypothetical protein
VFSGIFLGGFCLLWVFLVLALVGCFLLDIAYVPGGALHF